MKRILFCYISILSCGISFGQKDSCLTIRYKKKIMISTPKENEFSVNDFYLYRNVNYNFKFRNDIMVSGRLTDFTEDSLFIMSHFNENVATRSKKQLDTNSYSFRDLEAIEAIGDRAMGIFQTLRLQEYEKTIGSDTMHCAFRQEFVKMYDDDPEMKELVPYFTVQGYDLLYEENGYTYYFQGTGGSKPKPEPVDTIYRIRNFIGFTPSKTDEINGLGIGLGGYSNGILINGINIELPFFHTIYILGSPYNHLEGLDSNGFYATIEKNIDSHFNGINIGVTHFSLGSMKGIQIHAFTTVTYETRGLTITGLRSEVYEFRGLNIAGINNRASEGRGVQIGLINKCHDLRGIQFGLWCKNGKRSLPFFNWQFKANDLISE